MPDPIPQIDPSPPAPVPQVAVTTTSTATVAVEAPLPEALPGMPAAKTFWQSVAAFFFRYGFSMLMEEKGDHWAMSLGRVSTAALLLQAMWTWHTGLDLIPGQKEVLYVLIGYTFGSKALTSAKDIVSTIKG